jgi:hypothetical protein
MSTPEFDDLSKAVADNGTVTGSFIVFTDGIAAKLDALVAAGTINPADVTALATNIKATSAAIAADLVKNTPPTPPAAAAAQSVRRTE